MFSATAARRVMLQKGLRDMGQNLIRAVANEHPPRGNIVAGRDRLAQIGSARIGVEAQTIRRGGDRNQDAGRRSVRILVGVKLDDAIQLWPYGDRLWTTELQKRLMIYDSNGGSSFGRIFAESRHSKAR